MFNDALSLAASCETLNMRVAGWTFKTNKERLFFFLLYTFLFLFLYFLVFVFMFSLIFLTNSA